MNNRRKAIILFITIFAIVISFLIGNVYANYITKLRGKGMAKIATWDFKVNGNKEEVQTIKLSSNSNSENIKEERLAPGSKGGFDIIIDGNNSKVGVLYNVSFSNEKDKPSNLKFKYNGEEYKSILELNDKINGKINANAEEKIKNIHIDWEWKYQTGNNIDEIRKNDLIDTENAEKLKEYSFEVIVTGTQVDPS